MKFDCKGFSGATGHDCAIREQMTEEILTQATATRSVTRLRLPGALCGNSSRRATIETLSCGTFCCRVPTLNDESHRLLLQVPRASTVRT